MPKDIVPFVASHLDRTLSTTAQMSSPSPDSAVSDVVTEMYEDLAIKFNFDFPRKMEKGIRSKPGKGSSKMPVEVLLVVSPTAGMEEQAQAALLKLSQDVQKTEQQITVLPYKATRHHDGSRVFCVHEKCVDHYFSAELR